MQTNNMEYSHVDLCWVDKFFWLLIGLVIIGLYKTQPFSSIIWTSYKFLFTEWSRLSYSTYDAPVVKIWYKVIMMLICFPQTETLYYSISPPRY